LEAALAELKAQEDAFNNKTNELKAKVRPFSLLYPYSSVPPLPICLFTCSSSPVVYFLCGEKSIRAICAYTHSFGLTLQSEDESIGLVTRNKAKAELAQHLSSDPLPLRRAKITQEAAVKKADRATQAAADARLV